MALRPEDPVLNELRARVQDLVAPNCCWGTALLDSTEGGLFYRKSNDSDASFLSFTEGVPKNEDIEKLIEACQPATFGRGEEDVFDESYRKAWKMNTAQFAAQFDVARSSIMDRVHDQLLLYEKSTMRLEPQLYKLNIYGPGSFFKSHVDTPRNKDLFASLVVVLPTVHTGGNLLIGSKESLFNFDSSRLVFHPVTKAPQVAFAAFYSDIDHEVSPVVDGYRITLTYNLHLVNEKLGLRWSLPPDRLTILRDVLIELVLNDKVLPCGGALGFGLVYKYPIDPKETSLEWFTGALKGNDALIRAACEMVGLEASVKVLYRSKKSWMDTEYIVDETEEDGAGANEETDMVSMISSAGGKEVTVPSDRPERSWYLPLIWVTEKTRMMPADWTFMTYGNEYTVDCVYGDLVLIARCPRPQERIKRVVKRFPELKERLGEALGNLSDSDEEMSDYEGYNTYPFRTL